MNTKPPASANTRWPFPFRLCTVHCALRTLPLFALIALLSSCGPSRQRADLVFAQSAEPETVDPAMVTDQVSMRIEESLFEGLCRMEQWRAGDGE